MSEGRDVGLESLLYLALRHGTALAAALLLTPAAAILGWSLLPNVYEASARLLIQEEKHANPFLQDLAVEWTLKNRLPLIESVMESRATLEGVLRKTGALDAHATQEQVELEVRAFARKVEVIGLGGGLVKLKVQGATPKFVHHATQALVDTFVTEMLRPQKQAVQISAKFLDDQMSRLRGEIVAMEGNVAGFKSDHMAELPELHKLNLEAHLDLQKSLVEAEARLAARERQKLLFEEKLKTLDPLGQKLELSIVDERARLSNLEVRFPAGDARVRESYARLERLRADLADQARERHGRDLEGLEAFAGASETADRSGSNAGSGRIDLLTTDLLNYKAIVSELEGTKSEVSLLKERLLASEQNLRAQAKSEHSLGGMQRDLDIKVELYRSLLEKYESALVTQQLSVYDESNQIWTVEAPMTPTHSLKPPLVWVIAGSVVASWFLALLTLGLCALMDDRVRGTSELAEVVGAPLVARMPRSPRA